MIVLVVLVASGALNCIARPSARNVTHRDVPSIVETTLTHPAFDWVSALAPGFSVHAVEGSYAAEHLSDFSEAVERAFRHDLELLRWRSDPPHLYVFFVTSREQIDVLAGRAAGGLAVPKQNTAFFVHDEKHHGQLRHELMHLLAYHRWGERRDSWVSEGLATFASGRCRSHGFRELAAALATEQRLLPLEEFEGEFTVTTVASYLQAASIIEFLYEENGLGSVRTLYREGMSAMLRALGLELVEFERRWRQWVIGGRTGLKVDWEAIPEFGCE